MAESATLTPIHIEEHHALSVTFAKDSASRDLREIDYALGQEAIADAYAYGQSIWHLAKAGYTGSVEPLIEGSHYFESAASTIPIIAPLVKERIEARKTHVQIRYLQDAIARDPNTPLYEANAWEIEILNNQDHDYDAPSPEKERNFFVGLCSDWKHTNSLKGYKAAGTALTSAIVDLGSLPFQEAFIDAAAEHHDVQLSNLIDAQETLKPGIHFHVDEDTGDISFSPDTVDYAIADYETRYNSRAWRLVWSSAATAGATNFIVNEVKKSIEYGEQVAEDVRGHISNIFYEANSEDVDPLSSTALSCALVLAHVLPATLTVAPLKKAANKVSEHCSRMLSLQRDLKLLKFVKEHGKHDPELSRFTPG